MMADSYHTIGLIRHVVIVDMVCKSVHLNRICEYVDNLLEKLNSLNDDDVDDVNDQHCSPI